VYTVPDIQVVNLEISTRCQAACPFCPRNYNGYGIRDGFPLMDMSLDEYKHILRQFLPNDDLLLDFCGTYGDPCISSNFMDIIEYTRSVCDNPITIHTNGSMHKPEWWKNLAKYDIEIEFGLDGLGDTHKIYRQNTSWTKILENAGAFIDAGGYAVWQFIEFAHNKHQKEACRELAKELGFKEFKVFYDNRNDGQAYTPKGEPYWIGDNPPETMPPIEQHVDVESFLQKEYENNRQVILDEPDMPEEIVCKSIRDKVMYVAVNGDAWPCCWLGGSFPMTYDTSYGYQLKALNLDINILQRPLQDVMDEWSKISNTWTDKPLGTCIEQCGKCDGVGGMETFGKNENLD